MPRAFSLRYGYNQVLLVVRCARLRIRQRWREHDHNNGEKNPNSSALLQDIGAGTGFAELLGQKLQIKFAIEHCLFRHLENSYEDATRVDHIFGNCFRHDARPV
jgi:hypothetical protein